MGDDPNRSTDSEGSTDEPKQKDRPTQIAVALIPPLLAAVATIIGAWLVFMPKMQELSLLARQHEDTVGERLAQRDEQRQIRYEQHLEEIIPMLLSGAEDQARRGQALLFVLYQDRADEVIETIRLVSGHDVISRLAPAESVGVARLRQSMDWIIVAGGDRSLEEANYEVSRANRLNLSRVTLYHRGGWYRSTFGPYPSREEAERANIAVSAVFRRDAYVVSRPSWCPVRRATENEALIECLDPRNSDDAQAP